MPIATAALGAYDFGLNRQKALEHQADGLFGIGKPIADTATPDPNAVGAASVKLASGLKVKQVLRGDIAGPDGGRLASNADMIAFWPSDTKPVWAIVCIENGATTPGVQRIKLRGADRGKVETLLRGTTGCDGIRRTPWGTILATEEKDDGNGRRRSPPACSACLTWPPRTTASPARAWRSASVAGSGRSTPPWRAARPP